MLDWKVIGIAALVVVVGILCLTFLAGRGLVPAALVANAIIGLFSAFGGWIAPRPLK